MAEPEAIGAGASVGERSDAAPDSVALRLDARMVRVPGWWARAEGYRDGEALRPEDAARAETVSAAARGALAAMDRLTARRRVPVEAPKGAGPGGQGGRGAGRGRLWLVVVALLSAALTLAVSQPLLRLFGELFARIAG